MAYKKASRLNKTLYNVPVHCLTPQEQNDEFSKGIYAHFHRPTNECNRFMSSIVGGDKLFLREFERPAPFTVWPVHEGGIGTRPAARPTPAVPPTRRPPACAQQQAVQQGSAKAAGRGSGNGSSSRGSAGKQREQCQSLAAVGARAVKAQPAGPAPTVQS